LVRIFSVLAVVALLLLAGNFLIGLAGGDFQAAALAKRQAQQQLSQWERLPRAVRQQQRAQREAAQQAVAAAETAFRGPRRWMTLHMFVGSLAALMTVLVSSLAITYFIGTSRWCQEVCQTYDLAPELARRAQAIKRRAFPWSLSAILTVVAVVGLGAAADPSGANWQHSASLVMPHFLLAAASLGVVGAAFWVQLVRMHENHALIETILAEVRRIRAARHLPVEEVPA
jgi:hypothetical protein